MARQLRIDYPGAFHHVMNRGAARQATFRDDNDRAMFLELWALAVSRFGIEVITFVLMGNHYHLLVHSPDGQLSATMQFIGRAYTQWFNDCHGRDGALFRGRFHSLVVDSDKYFSRVARYIELNPLSAGVCNDLDTYEWSTFKYYTGIQRPPSWLATRHLRSRFDSPGDYRSFVLSGAPDNALERFYSTANRFGTVIGNSDFVAKLEANEPELAVKPVAGIPDFQLADIEQAVQRVFGDPGMELSVARTGPKHLPLLLALQLVQELTFASLDELACRYGFSSTRAVSAALTKARNTAALDSLRRAVIDEIS